MIDFYHKKLKNLKDLKPNSETNSIFSELCSYCIEKDKNIKINEKVLEINKICSKAEFELEKYRSEKIIKSENPKKELQNFPYFENYKKLTKLEFLNCSFFEENINEVLFIGGGPLPLSAIILVSEFGLKCKIIDLSSEAIELGKKLVEKIGLKEKIVFEKKDILDYKDEKNYDLIYGASLVFGGENQEKIIKNLKKLNFGKLLIRSSNGKRQLLYKKIDKNILKKHFKIELIVHPKNEIINSFIILNKK